MDDVVVEVGAPEEAEGLEYVGFWPRAVARALDAVINYAASDVFGGVIGAFLGVFIGILEEVGVVILPDAISDEIGLAYYFLLLPITFISMVLAEAAAESISGVSLGKLCLGLVVTTEEGGRISFVAGIKRSVAFFVDTLFFGLVAYLVMKETPRFQRLGDKWAHTVVVRRKALPEELRPTTGRIVAGIAAAAGISGVGLALGVLSVIFL
jgi:uncharacterized RDD family membrane protein YckC